MTTRTTDRRPPRSTDEAARLKRTRLLVQDVLDDVIAAAKDGYATCGRGFVVVERHRRRWRATYHQDTGTVPDLAPALARLVGTYDASRDVVVVVADPDGTSCAIVCLLDPTPPPPPVWAA